MDRPSRRLQGQHRKRRAGLPHDRGALASAFVAKAVLGLTTTTALIERLKVDRALRRICGFSMWKRVPDPSTFSRAFDEFTQAKLAERVHEALVRQHLGQSLTEMLPALPRVCDRGTKRRAGKGVETAETD